MSARCVLEEVDLAAPSVALESEAGAVELAGYWRDRIAVLVFLRHFG